MRKRRRIIQGLLILVIVAFAVRELRLLWNVEGFEIFDLAFWGIKISDEVYTSQNLFMFWGSIITLILISMLKRDSPKVLSVSEHAPDPSGDDPSQDESPRQKRGEREKSPKDSPFTDINKEWKVVFPKEEKKTKGRKG